MKQSLIPSCLFVVFCLTGLAFAQEPRPEADPAKANADYALQGEYTGELGDMKLAAQIIALGDDAFEVVGYMGGLPGGGWDGKDPERIQVKRAEDSSITFAKDEVTGVLSKEGLTLTQEGIGKIDMKRLHRTSSTLGKKPPEGAVVLFDGTGVDAFEKGRMTGDGLLMEGTKSKQKFQSHHLHLEFRTPYKPKARGQGRGNSGVYVQGRYECQVLDSFGLAGKHNECGGIYSVKDPDENMCYPPLTWQTYDIEFTAAEFDGDGKKTANARMTVKHNGVVIHDDIEVPKSTTASPLKEGADPGFLFLQNHGSPVRYQNIWVVPK